MEQNTVMVLQFVPSQEIIILLRKAHFLRIYA